MAERLREFRPTQQQHASAQGFSSAFLQYESLIQDAQYLHVLATQPSTILPPGKSLASIFSNASESSSSEPKAQIEAQVSEIVHNAFWAEAKDSLSADLSATVMNRLSGLYNDMHGMLASVLPPTNDVMITLSSPLSPTTSPLHSSRNLLQSVLVELRKVCAPARDAEIDVMLEEISTRYPNADGDELPSLIIRTIRTVFTVIQEMTSDLHNFALASLSEEDLLGLVTFEARRREVELVFRLYGGRTGVLRAWNTWVAPEGTSTLDEEQADWRMRLLAALGRPVAISITPPPFTDLPPEIGAPPSASASSRPDINPMAAASQPESQNMLPPPFLISSPSVFRIQNLIQAVVITACLQLLAYPPSPSSLSARQSQTTPSHPSSSSSESTPPPRTDSVDVKNDNDSGEEFASRVWTLLEGEVDRGGHAPAETKLINFEDEVWQRVKTHTRPHPHPTHPSSTSELLQSSSSLAASTPQTQTSNPSPSEEERKVRANVQRILRADDPVFALFTRRFLSGLAEWLPQPTSASNTGMDPNSNSSTTANPIPMHMRTGRQLPGLPSLSLLPSSSSTSRFTEPSDARPFPAVKGFEGQILHNAMTRVAHEVASAVRWVDGTWGSVLGFRRDGNHGTASA